MVTIILLQLSCQNGKVPYLFRFRLLFLWVDYDEQCVGQCVENHTQNAEDNNGEGCAHIVLLYRLHTFIGNNRAKVSWVLKPLPDALF